MNQILEIPDAVYAALLKAAHADGATPTQWIIAHLPCPLQDGKLPEDGAQDEAGDVETNDDLAEQRPWRGVYALSPSKVPLFTQEIDIDNLPKGKPSVTVNSRRVISDDEPTMV